MFSFNPVQWAKSLFRSRVKTIVKRRPCRLFLEELENRLAPATYTWTGGGGAANPGWATAANWGGIAINQAQPIDLVFSTATAYATNNNLNGLSINSITFNNSNFSLIGNQITLGNPATSGSGFIIVQGGLSGENIGLNMQLAGSGSSSQFFTVHTGSTLTVSGQISGATGSQLTVQGGGTVILSGNNNGYVGPFTINNDQSIVQAQNSNALGGITTSTVETLTLNSPGLSPATTFKLTYGSGAGSQTGNITYTGTSADSGAVQTALNALTTIQNGGGGSVQVYQTNTGTSETFVITFTGSYTGTNVTTHVTAAINSGAGSFSLPSVVAGGVASPYVVTVGNNSQLQLVGGAGSLTIPNTVHLFGAGAANTGALVNVSGTNTWSGSIVLENIGTNPNYIDVRTPLAPNPSQLTVSGIISDTGSGGSMTKNGGGTLILTNANTYRGSTFIENGVLNIQNPLALGSVPSAGTYTQDNPITGDAGTLQLQYVNAAFPAVPANSQLYIRADPTQPYSAANPYVGFVVPNYSLFLLGPGFGAAPATLDNVAGDNAWSGPITMETDTAHSLTTVNIDVQSTGAAPNIIQSQLAITGVIGDQDPSNPATLTKANIGQGNLVLEPTVHTASVDLGSSYKLVSLPGGFVSLVEVGGAGTANPYLGSTNIGSTNAGTVTLVDSQGLGPTTKAAMTTVGGGSSLNLVANVGHIDSVTSTTNRLLVDAPTTISGAGYPIAGQDEGTIHSISGINTYGPNASYNAANPAAPFTLTFSVTNGTIGVEPDPTGTSNNSYFTNDYSLTITGGIGNTAASFDPVSVYVTKVDAGQLILPNANRFFYGAWDIQQGWVTVQNSLSLGGLLNGSNPNLAPAALFTTTVQSGAALMLRPLNPNTSFTLNTNLILEGNGISHSFPLISQRGAVENLEGVNTLAGNVTFIGQVGIGVEQIDPTILSNLTMTGELTQAQTTAAFNSAAAPATINIPNTFATGGISQYTQIVDTGSTQGSLVLNYANFAADNVRVYYGPVGTPGSTLVYNTTLTGSGTTAAINFGPGAGTQIEIVIDGGVLPAGSPAWSYNGAVTVSPGYFTGGLIKLGSQRLVLEGNGTFQGGVDVRSGIVVVASNNALGTPLNTGAPGLSFGTTVEAGAALVLSPSLASLNGGQSTGLSISGNHLTLSGTGNSQFGDAPLTVTAADNLWSGPITLSSDFAITYQNNLGNQALPARPITANFMTAAGATTLTGTDPTVTATTTTAGAPGLNDVETLTFGGTVGGGTFTLTVWDGTTSFTTGSITWVADPNALIQAIQAALNLDALLVGNFMVSLISPIIDVAPNARLIVSGSIDDGTIVPSPLIHNYALSGSSASYSDTVGSTPITPVGGSLTSAGYTWANVTGANQGLTLPATALADPNNYTIQLDFSLATVNPVTSSHGYDRIINYGVTTAPSDDNGLYTQADTGTGARLVAYPLASNTNGANDTFQNGVAVDLVVTRDSATGNVQAYINGVAQFLPFGFNDSVAFPTGHEFVPQSATLAFFIDNLITNPDEVSAGTATSVKIYDRPLTAAEVAIVAAGGTLTGSSTLPADLIVAGGGTLQLSGTNTYRGTTYVNQGTLTVSNGQALGTTPGTGQQSIALTNAVPGVTKFQLSFGAGAGSQTGQITYTGTAADAVAIQTALQGLTTIGSGNAEVIQENPGVFLVTFPNAPLSSSTDLISPTIVAGTGVTGTAIVAGLSGGTEVANNAQLQMQGGITVAGEPLTLQGSGGNLEPTEQTYTVSTTTLAGFTGAYTLNFNNASALSLTGNTTINSAAVTGLASTTQLAVGMTVSGGGVPLGTTILAITGPTTITLSANATVTASPTLTFTIQLAYNASAAQIQADLQSLATVGSQGGQVSVSVQSVSAGANDTQTFFVPNTATAATNFGLTFGPTTYDPTARSTGNIFTATTTYDPNNYFSDAAQIANALNALANIGGASVGGLASVVGSFATANGVAGILFTVTFSDALANRANLPALIIPASGAGAPSGPGASGIAVKSHTQGSAPSITYQTIFQGAFSGINQPLLSVPSVSGTTAVSTPALTLTGGSANNTPDQWFSTSQGTGTLSTAITGVQSYYGTANAENASGPVTSVAVDPTNANVIYVATAGGGAWRTQDGGLTWQPLFDSQFAGANPAVLFGGAIAVDPNHVNIIYYGAGNDNISGISPGVPDSYYGSGVYESQNFGLTWTLLTDTATPAYTVNIASPGNPLYGTAISKIVVLDSTGATPGAIAVAASDVNAGNGIDVNGLAGNAGVWLYNRGTWTNTTAGVTPTGGVAFPSTNGDYVDLFYDGSTLYTSVFAGGTSAGQTGVYSAPTFLTSAPGPWAWTVTDSFPVGTVGETRLAGDSTVTGGTLFASEANAGALGQIQSDPTPGTGAWAATATPPTGIPDYLNPTGNYANAIFFDHVNGDLYVGGSDQVAGGVPGTNFVLQSTDQGVTWTDIVNGAATGPHTGVHSITADANGNLIVGTDGGVWTFNITTTTWTDLTGNLANSQFVSVATDPNNPNIILAGGHSVGIDLGTLGAVGQAAVSGGAVTGVTILNGDSGYFQAAPPSVTFVGGGGSGATATATVNAAGVVTGIILNTPGSGYTSAPQVVIAPSGVQTWTQVAGGGNNLTAGNGTQSDGGQVAFDPVNPGVAYYQEAGFLEISTDNGVTWTNATIPYAATPPQYAPFAISPSNPSVLVAGQLGAGSGLGQYSGFLSGTSTDLNAPATFVVTSLGVSDFQGAYQSDPAFPNLTVFAANHTDTATIYITDGTHVDVTKNLGTVWAANRGPTLAAGTTITKLIVDPADRDTAFVVTSGNSGTAGVGHVFETTNAGQTWTDISAGLPDLSVWSIAVDPRTNDIYVGNDIGIYKLAGGVGTWQKFGAGLPNVMVADININTNANVLTAATYGRGVWQFYLDDTQASAGALRALAGNDIWTGPITLVGPTTIGANGSQNLQNGFSGAELTLLGTISDSTASALGNTLTKIGGGDVVLSGSNTYAGVTIVQQGNVLVNNPNALGGGAVAGSQLLSFTGMVAGISEFNLTFGAATTAAPLVYTGVPATDAADIQAALIGLASIGASNAIVTPANAGAFLITFPNAPLAASAQLVSATVVAGLNGSAIGAASSAGAGATVVTSGAALELQSNLNLEPITLNGNGIQPPYNGHFTGALVNVSNFNTFTGTITLNTNSTIGVTAGQLVISSANANGIVDGGHGYSLDKEGSGTLVLASADAYSGGTTITAGAVQIQNSLALGPVASSTTVTEGAQLQLQAGAAPVLTSADLTSGGNLALNVPYFYVVTAVSAIGDESALSNSLPATPLVSGTQAVTLAWSPVPGAVSYRVYRSTTAGNFTNALLSTVTTPGFIDTGLGTLPGSPLGLNVGQHLFLGGSGVLNDGALQNLAGNNTWSGAVTLVADPNFSPASATAGVVAIYVDPNNSLRLAGQVNEGLAPAQPNAPVSVGTAPAGLAEIGAGTLILANSNTYTGGTYVGYVFGTSNTNGASAPASIGSGGVNGGVIDVQNSNALGANQGNEIQRITTYDPPGASDTFNLSFNGQTTSNLTFGAPATGVAGPNLSALATQAGGNLTVGSTFYYVVTATVGGSETLQSNERNTGVIAANKTAHLTWTAIAGATYNVYRATATGAYSSLSLMNAVPLAVGTTQFTDDGTVGPFAGTPPTDVQDALNGLSSISANGGSVAVARTSLYNGLDEVQSLALTNPISALNVPTGFTAALPAVAAGGNLAPSTQYYYKITAVTPLGESIPTAQASATTTNAAGNNLTIDLSWTAVPGATSYKIYRSTTANNFTQAFLASVTTTSFADAGPSSALFAPVFNGLSSSAITVGGTIPSGTYNYVITAIGASGESAISTAVSAIVPTALSGAAEVRLTWAVVPGATGYRIYRSTTTNYSNALIAVISSSAFTSFTDTNAPAASLTPPVQTKFTLRSGSNTVLTGTTTGTATVTLSSTAQLSAGMQVTGTGVPAGTTILTVTDATHVTLSNSVTAGTPSLTFIPVTPAIFYTGIGGTGVGSDAAAIQAALSGLKTVGAGNILVTPDATDSVFTLTFIGALSDAPQATIAVAGVAQSTATAAVTETTPGDGGITYIYTITFNGAPLAGAAQPLIVATPSSAAMSAGVTEVATGGFGALVYNGSALQVDGDPSNSGAPAIVLPANETIALNGAGPGANGALLNISGNNTVKGNIILQSDTTLGASPTTQMTLTGFIQDAPLPASNPVPTSAPASVTKVGAGSVVLAPAAQTITLANAVSALHIPTLSAPTYSSGGSISTNFFYEVTIIGPSGESMPSTPMNTPIGALTNRIANLTWTNTLGAAATGYRIYRATSLGGPYTLLANIDSAAVITYADNGSTPLLVGTPPTQTKFTLSLGANTTGQITYTGLSSLATNIQSHLQTDILSGNYPGVTASVQALNANEFTVTYTGTSAALGAVPALTAAIVAGRPGGVAISTNTFAGDVYDNAGVLNIQSAQALGVSTSAVQEISVSGSSGTFSLTFNGSTTGALVYGLPAGGGASPTASVQNALNALPSINAINPNGVTVTQVGNNYFVDFNGAGLANTNQNAITYSILTPGISSITITAPLAGGAANVDVASGASLQTQSNFAAQAFSEASGKYLTIAGTGVNNAGALDNVSGANAWGAAPITLGTNPTAIGNADSTGAIFSINKPITDSFLAPTIQFSGFVNNDTYTLSYGGAVTGPLTYTGNNAADLAAIQAALAGLSSVIPLGGTVNVVSPAANQFTVTFTNTLYGTFTPRIGSLPITSAAGTFITPIGPATSNADGVNKVGVGIVQYGVGNTYTGTTNVVAGKLQFDNTTGVGFAINGPLVIGNTTPTPQVQTLTLGSVANPFTQFDQFTLSYGTSTTSNITYYQNPSYEAAAIQAALNAVLGANFVSVAAASANVFQVTLNGLAGPYPLSSAAITGANLTSTLAPVGSTINATPVPVAFTPGSAIAQLEANTSALSGQINPSAAVTVNSDGLYDLNGFTQTDATLTINVGTAQTGTGALTVTGALTINDGALDVQSSGGSVTANGLVTMTGGIISLAAGGTLNLNANLTAISDAAGPALITGQGTVQEGAATQTFTVTHGPAATAATTSDLIDSAVITGSGSAGLTKTGDGRMEITVQDTYPGSTTISQGDVRVDPVVNTTQEITLVGALGGTTQITLTSNGITAPAATFTYTGTTATDVASFQAALVALGIPAGNIVSVTGNGALDTIFTLVFNSALAPIMPAITSDPTANAPTGTNAFVTTTAASVNNVGAVVLNGATGSLSGAGFVGGITSTGPGIINPGVNLATATPGILTVNGNVTLAANDTLFVDLANPSGSHPNPIAGSDYDQLSVNGAVNLNGAILTGSVTNAVVATPVGDNFTILQASGGVTGNFSGDTGGAIGTLTDHVFIDGEKFLVTYNTNSVVLTHVLDALSSFTMTSSQNPSVYGQNVTFTVTAVAEPGASLSSGSPTFTITETPVSPTAGPPVVTTVAVPASGVYTYTPPSALFLNSGTSTFTVAVTFDDPNVFNAYPPATPTPATITQTVNQNTVDVGLSVPATIVYGQQIQFVGTATPHTPLNVTGAQPPTGNIEFTVDPTGVDQVTDAPISAGSSTLTVAPGTPPFLGIGSHTLTYQYVGFSPANVGDPNYAAGTLQTTTFTIAQDSSQILFTPVSTSEPLGQNAVINVLVTPNLVGSTGVPTGTVDFYNGVPDLVNFTNRLNSTPQTLVNAAASFATNTLSLGAHTIYVVYSGDVHYLGHTASEAFTVNLGATATTFVSANPASAHYGDQVNFTFRTVENPYIGAVYNPLVGNITVWADATSSGTISAVTGTGVSPIVITSANNGLTTGQSITVFGVTGDTAADGTFTVTRIDNNTFSIAATGNGAYTGGGTWVLGGTNLGTSSIDSLSGLATVLSPPLPNALSQGTHTITGFFNSTNPFFAGSNASVGSFVVSAAATHITSVTANPTSSTFGTAVTFTASVTTTIGSLPITGDVNSSVTFVDTTTGTTLGTGFLVAGGTASISTNLLNANTSPGHTITATYNDTLPTSQYSSSTGTLIGYHVAQAPTTVTIPTAAPASGSYFYGTPGGVTFSAIASSTAGPLPVGAGSIISFYNGAAIPANLLGTGTINAAGAASYATTPLQLNAGLRTITAVYSDTFDNNFANSAAQALSNFSVHQATDGVAVSASPASGDVYGQSVTFTATITVSGSSTAAVPDAVNDVRFVDTTSGTTLGFGSTTGGTGVATLTTTALTANIAAGHTITATYTDPAGNLATAASILSGYHVALASAAVALATSAPAPGGAAIGHIVTFTATVSNTTAGSLIAVNNTTAPGSSVTFKNSTTGSTLGTVPVNASGVATLTIAFTSASAVGYAITAQYNISPTISPNFSASAIDAGSTVTQIVRQASTTTASSSAPSPTGATFGQNVNFTVTVAGTGGTPQGPVTVSIDGGSPVSVGSLNSTGHVTYSTTTLTVGTHSLVFSFPGDVTNNFAPSVSTALTQIVRAAAATALTSNFVGGSNYGQAVTFTATVTATGAPNPGVGMGTVTFRDTTTGVILAANVALNAAGQASYTTTAAQTLSVANHTITATYSGYTPTSGATYASGIVGSMVQVVSKAVTTVSTPTSSLSAGSSFGQSVTFYAVVTAASGGIPPITGATVIFKDGATTLGIGTVISATANSATYRYITTATQLSAATHSITATYNAPAGNFASSAPSPVLSQVVSQAATQTVLTWTETPATNYWAIGVPLTFSARVTATSAGTPGAPTGTVQFNIDGVLTVVPLVNGVARMPAPTTFGGSPPTNSHTVTVTYQPTLVPNQNFAVSTATMTKNVLNATTLALSSSAGGTSPTTGTAVTFTAVVSTTAPGGPPTGTLYFLIDGVSYLGTLFSSTGTSDTYKLTTTALTAGTHTISAHYSGDANFNPADPAANLTQSITRKVGRST